MSSPVATPIAVSPYLCPGCHAPIPEERPANTLSCCSSPYRLHAGRIRDFLGDDDSDARAILGWSEELWHTLLECAEPLHHRQALPEKALEPLRSAGLIGPEGFATELGRIVSYHIAETGWQKKGDLLRELLVDRTRIGPDSHILDVGCGAGTTLHYLAPQGPARRVGVDRDIVSLAVGHRLHGEHGPELVCGDALALPLRDGSFTHVLSRVALNYVPQMRGLREMVRVLEPGGYLGLRFEALGHDLGLIGHSPTLAGKLIRTASGMAGLFFQVSGCQLPLRRLGGRNYASAYRLGRILRKLGCEVVHVEVVTSRPRVLGMAMQKVLLARRVR